jgi:VWFA-related protein
MQRGVLLLLATAVWAQEPQFGTRVNEVIVPVSVMTKSGKPVENLAAKDFSVLNDGKPQPVRLSASDASGILPIHPVVVVQTDDGSQPALAKIKKDGSIISYITNDMEIGTPSLAAVVTVADEVRVAQDFTTDPNRLGDTFTKISAKRDASRLLDGVNLALRFARD